MELLIKTMRKLQLTEANDPHLQEGHCKPGKKKLHEKKNELNI